MSWGERSLFTARPDGDGIAAVGPGAVDARKVVVTASHIDAQNVRPSVRRCAWCRFGDCSLTDAEPATSLSNPNVGTYGGRRVLLAPSRLSGRCQLLVLKLRRCLIGQPFRVRYLERALDSIMHGRNGICNATGGEAGDWCLTQTLQGRKALVS